MQGQHDYSGKDSFQATAWELSHWEILTYSSYLNLLVTSVPEAVGAEYCQVLFYVMPRKSSFH